MTNRDAKLERLQAAQASINNQTLEDLEIQAKYVAANMFLMYGGQALRDAGGFVHATVSGYATCLYWLIAEGYVTVTDKAQVTDEEVAERAKHKEAKAGELTATEPSLRNDVGKYL